MTPSASASERALESPVLDEAIGRMETLYRAMTGTDAPAPASAGSRIPVERDPGEYVDEQVSRLLDLLSGEGTISTRAFPGGATASATAARGPSGAEADALAWTPALSVVEDGAEVIVRVDLPGVAREAVEVRRQGQTLTIAGSRPAPGRGEGRLRHADCPYGRFRRVIVLRDPRPGVEPSARLKDGVLEIRVARETSPTAGEPKAVPVT